MLSTLLSRHRQRHHVGVKDQSQQQRLGRRRTDEDINLLEIFSCRDKEKEFEPQACKQTIEPNCVYKFKVSWEHVCKVKVSLEFGPLRLSLFISLKSV